MPYFFAAIAAAFLLTGCATNEEDRQFFNHGWMSPDKAADKRFDGRGTTFL